MVNFTVLFQIVRQLIAYARFLGPRMIYTSGIVTDLTREESLEELQDNKLKVVCDKVCHVLYL